MGRSAGSICGCELGRSASLFPAIVELIALSFDLQLCGLLLAERSCRLGQTSSYLQQADSGSREFAFRLIGL
jgi:hypothetical protein